MENLEHLPGRLDFILVLKKDTKHTLGARD
jgi:hypothetical protein